MTCSSAQFCTLRRMLLSIFSLLAATPVVFAATPTDSLTLTGNVRDAYSYDYLDGVRVELLSPSDSAVVVADTCRNLALGYDDWFRKHLERVHADMGDHIKYTMRTLPGDYLLRCSREGYATLVTPLSIPAKTYGRRTKAWKAPEVLLFRQMERQLGEATARATKIMMINKGDTVVFNADYFQLSQGSMLDQLVTMLPGMEIKDGGQIYYNGKRLENLYVNGKDFFNGDPKVALQNLPAYMVKRLKVYKKEDDDAYMDRHRDTVSIKEPNTLDVTLKKEYNKGWMANVQLGGGPAQGTPSPWEQAKYKGKLFAQYYQDNMRLSIIGNVNNVSNTEVADDDGSWRMGWYPGNGVLKLVYGGINYNASSKKHKLDYVLKLTATSEKTDHETQQSATTFLTTADTYSRTHKVGEEQHPHVYMNHTLTWTGKRLYVYAFVGADYFDDKSDWRNRSAQFSADPADAYRGAALDTVFATPYSRRLADILTNRMEQTTMGRGETWWQLSRLNLTFKDPLLGNKVSISSYGQFTYTTKDHFEHYDLRYPDAAANDFRNRYNDQFTRSYWATVTASYSFQNMMSQELAKRFNCNVSYNYKRNQGHQHSWLYNLHEIPGWGYGGGDEAMVVSDAATGQTPELGMLPSMVGWQEMAGVKDLNSNRTVYKTDEHMLNSYLRLGSFDTRWGYLTLYPTLHVRHDRYTDSRADGSVDRRLTNGHINITYAIERKKKVEETKQLKKVLSLNYETSCDPVNPNRLLSVRDDSNPLSITLGNPSLKHGRHHYFNVRGSLSLPSTAYVGFHANFELYHNAVAMGYAYNERTGAYTYRPENVDGNRRAYAYLSYSSPLGQKHIYEFSGSTSWSMNHSVDIIDTRLSTVDNHSLDQRLELTARWNDRVTLKLSGNVAWQYATSERENYHTRNTWDLNYGPEFRVKLLADLQLHTTLSVFQRRGYDDSSMNSTEMVWNANLEWNFDFRRCSYARSATAADAPAKSGPRPWTLSVKAHDLLQQLSNTHRVLNAQGITETWYNTVPSYLMLSLTYRFAQLPKKKQ